MEAVYKMHYLKTHLSSLVDQVDAGQKLIFGVGGQRQYVISKYVPDKANRGGYGSLKSQKRVDPDLGGWTAEQVRQFESQDELLSA